MTTIKEQILDLSRQNQIAPLSPYFDALLDIAIAEGYFPDEAGLATINAGIIEKTELYRESTKPDVVVLGMSGGVDSALTATLMKAAGYSVIGVTMPINQNPEETQRGKEACDVLGIEHRHIDLSDLYDQMCFGLNSLDDELVDNGPAFAAPTFHTKIRRGNIRARLRMITLYNLASLMGGFVASTDNLSELGAGFWTLHGDVGDYSPIQSLLKSWEVPYLARLNGVPESTVRATPTDGLGIHAGDEAQLGCSYLEWDLMTYALAVGFAGDGKSFYDSMPNPEEGKATDDPRAQVVFDAVVARMGSTWFKRRNPLNVPHPLEDRYELIDSIDRTMFVPESFR